MNSSPVFRPKNTPFYLQSSSIIYLAAGSLAAVCILIILAYYRYHVQHRTEESLNISARSYTFYEYNQPPRLQITHQTYGATKDRMTPPISPEKVVEWIKTRDKVLTKYAAVESMV
ncbi:hypothetical protein BGW37DRAFT_559968 [Umbelopsis sp. PMI_123]|nr:hypothetical protein BGW37DRAFT_559968 [Umbelopsis sp. PMI_123]